MGFFRFGPRRENKVFQNFAERTWTMNSDHARYSHHKNAMTSSVCLSRYRQRARNQSERSQVVMYLNP